MVHFHIGMRTGPKLKSKWVNLARHRHRYNAYADPDGEVVESVTVPALLAPTAVPVPSSTSCMNGLVFRKPLEQLGASSVNAKYDSFTRRLTCW
mmetsp:Transcript_25153/g.38420  ORF Transcript_25153/g.38420 Transcript_25153/m.38420 type:complete len:94 (-) Transcript_25153:1523-1804(-)